MPIEPVAPSSTTSRSAVTPPVSQADLVVALRLTRSTAACRSGRLGSWLSRLRGRVRRRPAAASGCWWSPSVSGLLVFALGARPAAEVLDADAGREPAYVGTTYAFDGRRLPRLAGRPRSTGRPASRSSRSTARARRSSPVRRPTSRRRSGSPSTPTATAAGRRPRDARPASSDCGFRVLVTPDADRSGGRARAADQRSYGPGGLLRRTVEAPPTSPWTSPGRARTRARAPEPAARYASGRTVTSGTSEVAGASLPRRRRATVAEDAMRTVGGR